MTLSERLRARVLVRDKKDKRLVKIPRGAVSRLAEYIGVAPSTVQAWLLLRREPSIHVKDKVKEVLKLKSWDLLPFKTGPKKENCTCVSVCRCSVCD